MEALDFLSFLRMVVLGPLLHIRNGNLPRGVRKVEADLADEDLASLISTVPAYDKQSLLTALRNAVSLYRQLRKAHFGNDIQLRDTTEDRVMQYFNAIESQQG